MKINNKSIPGIFIFDKNISVEYELNDFVVRGKNIYICRPKKSSSVVFNATDDDVVVNNFFSENFIDYLGGREATWEDFENTYNNLSIEDDPLITCTSLVKILKKISFGIDSDGLINGYIDSNKISSNLIDLLKCPDDCTINILDQLILVGLPEFNNMALKVSRDLLKNYLPKSDPITGKTDINYLLLKHYTYTENQNIIRIQEIIDPFNSVCLYRYSKRRAFLNNVSDIQVSDIGRISKWKLSCTNTTFLGRLDTLLQKNDTPEASTSFCFKKLDFKIDEIDSNNIVITSPPDDDELTINILVNEGDNKWKNYNLTGDFSNTGGVYRKYYITNTIYLTRVEDSKYKISISDTNNFKITSIYYKHIL